MAMKQEVIKELLSREPFQPFRIVMSSGKEYEVKNPALVHAMRADVFYCYPDEDSFALLPLIHIATVEVQQAV
jgi:hypothetical protein